MLGTASTQQLFASATSIGVVPQVWAEWNYNSFYSPAFTTSGSGSDLATAAFENPTNWFSEDSSSVTFSSTTLNRGTQANNSGSAIVMTIVDNTGTNRKASYYHGTAYSPTLTLGTSSSYGFYKIVFYAKVLHLNSNFNQVVNMIPTVSASSISAESSIFTKCKIFETENGYPKTSDGTVEVNTERWQKIEYYFGSTADNQDYDKFLKFKLRLDLVGYYYGAQVAITDFSVYKITEHDYFFQDIFPSESPFYPNRPGETLLHPLLPSSDKIVYYNGNTTSSASKPVNFISKIEDNAYSSELLFPAYHTYAKYDDKFQYYTTTAKSDGPIAIQGFYDQKLSINKIVLKMDNLVSEISSGSVNLYINGTKSVKIPISASSINDNGICVLYYNGANWSTSSWSSPPKLTASGTLQSVTASVTGIELLVDQMIDGVSKAKENNYKLRLIELSPRLELDLSDYVRSINVKKDITSSNETGLPFSYINSNSGTIELANIPVYQTNNSYGTTVFENESKNSAFNNLMRQGVKFTAMLKPSSYENTLKETVPLFVMYSDSWNINDIESVSVELFDVSKLFMMGSESMHFFSKNAEVFDVVRKLLDYSGFSDYDYNGLYNISSNVAPTTAFWTDEQKTVFQNLQEFLLPQQFAAYIDEYGMLRFKSLLTIFNNYTADNFVPNFAVTDFTVSNISSSSITYVPNIVIDSFSETTGQRIGGVVINYKTPLVFDNLALDSDTKNIASELLKPIVDRYEVASEVWKEKNGSGLSQFFINDGIEKSDAKIKYQIDKVTLDSSNTGTSLDARRKPSDWKGDLFIGSEIIGYDGIEYTFQSASNPYVITRTLHRTGDIDNAISDLKYYTDPQYQTASIQYFPTGYLDNIVRGKYGTTVSDHPVYSSSTGSAKMGCYSYNPSARTYLEKNATYGWGSDSKNLTGVLKTWSSTPNLYSILTAKAGISAYNFFSAVVKLNEETGYEDAGWLKISTGKVISDAIYNKYVTKDEQKKLYVRNKQIKVKSTSFGFAFNINGADNTPDGATVYFIEFKKVPTGTLDANKIPNFKYTISIYNNMAYGKTINYLVSEQSWDALSNLFDGELHDIRVRIANNSVEIKIDNNTSKSFSAQGITLSSAKYFGVYLKPLESGLTQQLNVYEIYMSTMDTIENRYHFTSKEFLDNIINNMANGTQSHFMYQSPPIAREIKFYDVKFENAPVIPSKSVYFQKISYKANENENYKNLSAVSKEDISYSTIDRTPYSAKFALVHNGPVSQGLIILNPPNTNGGKSTADNYSTLTLLGTHMKQSEEKVIKRIYDKNFANNTISLSIDWVRDETQVQKIIKTISKVNNGFNIDYNIRIFGNPLIQVGDFAQITYKLKRLGYDPNDASVKPIYCLITSIRNSYQDGLNNTELTLKPFIIT